MAGQKAKGPSPRFFRPEWGVQNVPGLLYFWYRAGHDLLHANKNRLVMSKKVLGAPKGRKLFEVFATRMDLHDARIHRPPQAGICGTPKDGCESIVLSGG
jgi:hypothetical protein